MSRNDPHRRNLPVSYPSRSSNSAPEDDVDIFAFLRNIPANPPRASQEDRSSSADRKRRHTGSEPERRDYPYPLHNGRSSLAPTSSSMTGTSAETAIDLTSSPDSPSINRVPQRESSTSRNRTSSLARRENDLVLPNWQPDYEVSRCPVCQREFTILYRRHHCRKCGKVVCGPCSPHRITIPRQYIVQPPNPFEDEANRSPNARVNSALGGGENVRVCNPCVPDPWMPESASTSTLNNTANAATGRNAISTIFDPPSHSSVNREPRSTQGFDPTLRHPMDRERPERYRSFPISGHAGPTRSRAQTHQSIPSLSRNVPQAAPAGFPSGLITPSQDSPYPRISSRHGHRYSYSHADNTGRSVPTYPSRAAPGPPAPPADGMPASPRVRPRKELSEDEECPVCGTELPEGDDAREAHIMQCIEFRSSSNPGPRQVPPAPNFPVPPPRTSSTGAARTNTTAPPVVPEGSRPRATSYRPGMVVYQATEKDCTTEDGNTQECVICMEDFEEGDEMGRMECLCKFHRTCIRQWWDKKGQGSCPTHQLHD